MIKICLYPESCLLKVLESSQNIFIKATKGLIFHFEKCHITQGGGGGGGSGKMSPNVTWGEGGLKCAKKVSRII
jgi:hypothetical protein